jgi:hypothetical protein
MMKKKNQIRKLKIKLIVIQDLFFYVIEEIDEA